MKRFFIALFVFLFLPLCALAAEDELDMEEYREYLNSYDLSFFEDTLGGDTYSLLRELGMNDFNPESLTSLSLDEVLKMLGNVAKNRAQKPLEGILTVLIFIILSSFFQSMQGAASGMGELYSTVSALIIAIVLIVKISPAVTLGASSVKIASNFIFAFVPVFGAIVAAGGGMTTAFSTNTMLLVLSQGLSMLSANIFMPVVNCFLGIGICSGLRAELQLERLVSAMKKIITSVISFTAGAFVSVLSLKTTIASRADILGIRSIRFVINSVVPVVGGALSEGLLSIQSYSSLIRSSVGIVGIAAISLVFLPAVIEAVLWRFVLSLGMIFCDVFGDKSVSLVLSAFKDTMLLINVILVVSGLTAIISFGVLIAARTA